MEAQVQTAQGAVAQAEEHLQKSVEALDKIRSEIWQNEQDKRPLAKEVHHWGDSEPEVVEVPSPAETLFAFLAQTQSPEILPIRSRLEGEVATWQVGGGTVPPRAQPRPVSSARGRNGTVSDSEALAMPGGSRRPRASSSDEPRAVRHRT